MTVYVDDEPWVDIHTKIFGKSLSLPSCDNLEQLREKFLVLEHTRAKAYALACLAMRSYLSTQLKKLLERNLVSDETIQKILLQFTQQGYLKDDEWIEGFVKGQLRRHTGAQAIMFKLMNKGISKKEAERWIEQLIDPAEAQNSLRHLLATKYKKHDLSDYRAKQKVFASLMRKGFDVENIKAALNCEDL